MDFFDVRSIATELGRLLDDGVAVVVDPSLHWSDILVENDPDSEDGWARIRVGERANLDWVVWLYTEWSRAALAQRGFFVGRIFRAELARHLDSMTKAADEAGRELASLREYFEPLGEEVF